MSDFTLVHFGSPLGTTYSEVTRFEEEMEHEQQQQEE